MVGLFTLISVAGDLLLLKLVCLLQLGFSTMLEGVYLCSECKQEMDGYPQLRNFLH